MTARKKEAACGKQTATTNRTSVYPRRNQKSTVLYRKIPPRPANRPGRTQTPARGANQRDRTALTLLGLAGNLQQSATLSSAERTVGWALFQKLLLRFLEVRYV